MSLRARVIWVGAIVVLSAVLAVPSCYSPEERRASPWIADNGINLGLDLQGGVHWLLRIDTGTAVRQELERTESVLREILEERGTAVPEIEVLETGVIKIEGSPDEIRIVRGLVGEEFDSLELAEENGVLSLRLTETWNREIVRRGVRQAQEVLRKRVDGLGVTEPVIASQGEGRILVQLPGEVDPEAAGSLLKRTTFLEFKHVLNAAPNEELLSAKLAEGVPEHQEIVFVRNEDDSVAEALLVPERPLLTGAMLEDASMSFDRRNRAIVLFTWNSQGARIFREFSGAHIGERMAAIVDGDVVTAPVIQDRIGRRGQISGQFTEQEAANLAVALRSGALPIPLVVEEERTVGPALGADSIQRGVRSILIGGTLAILFMLVYYRMSGLLADLALGINLVIIFAIMGLAGATLTLPGLAGLVLTIGMAVDANVIIFERIREELRSGKRTRNAVEVGFRRSRLTILDANITTLITALVLFRFGTGPIQGFAVTLSIGILSSVFCALIVTRLFIDLVLSRGPQALRI